MSLIKADLRAGETVTLSGTGEARVTFLAKSGQRMRIEVDAEPSMRVGLPKSASVLDVVANGLTQKLA
jgi:hypothetical protein